MIRLKFLEKMVANYDFLNRPLSIGFEYGTHPVLKKKEGSADFDIVPMEWGFLPGYVKTREAAEKFRKGYMDESGKFRPPIITLNAVGEEILFPNKIYRDAALHRRCLVLSTGFFEWRHIFPIGKKGLPLKTAVKYPYHVTVKDAPYFFIAGIWQPWTDRQTGEHVDTFSIVTTRANALMEQVHNSKKRMPVILTEDLAWEWLMENPDEKRITEIAGFQYPAQQMQAISIAKDFINADEPAEAHAYAELPELETSNK